MLMLPRSWYTAPPPDFLRTTIRTQAKHGVVEPIIIGPIDSRLLAKTAGQFFGINNTNTHPIDKGHRDTESMLTDLPSYTVKQKVQLTKAKVSKVQLTKSKVVSKEQLFEAEVSKVELCLSASMKKSTCLGENDGT